MLQNLHDGLLEKHCQHLSSASIANLTSSLALYVSKGERSKNLMEHARAMDLLEPVREFRQRVDGNPYSSSRLWRAVWSRLNGVRTERAAKIYKVDPDDVDWTLGSMTPGQLKAVEEWADTDWIRMPDYDGIIREVMSMAPYAKRWLAKKVSFLVKHDPSYTLEDIETDMMNAGLTAAFKSDNRTDSLLYLRNIAWHSAQNAVVSLIKHETTQSRQRIVRTGSVSHEATVRIYQRQKCWRCAEPSEKSFCSSCALVLGTETGRKAKWKTRIESSDGFMVDATPVETKTVTITQDTFMTTTTFMETPVGVDGSTATLGDLIEDSNASLRSISHASAELVHDLTKQPANVQKICAVLLGDSDPCFEQHLFDRYGSRAEQLKDKKIVAEACDFYGISKDDLQAAVGPMLGIVAD